MHNKLINAIKVLIVLLLVGGGTLIRGQNLFHSGFYFDTVTCFHAWGQAALDMGFTNFWANYNEYFDYLPGAVSLLMAVKWVALWFGESAAVFVGVLKMLNWGFDLLFIGLVAGLMARFQRRSFIDLALVSSFVYLLPSFWFVSTVWGQIDGMVVVMSIMALTMLFLAMKTSLYRSIGWAIFAGGLIAISFWIKMQAILFIPSILLVLLSFRRIDVFKYYSLSGFVTTLLIAIVPLNANAIRFFANLAQPFLRENTVSRSADTLWTLLGLQKRTSDYVFVINEQGYLTIGMLALILFGLVGLYALTPFLSLRINKLRAGFKNIFQDLLPRKVSLFEVYLFTTLITLSYFVLMPRMYERYLMAATMSIWFAFATAKTRIVQRWLFVLGTVLSVGHFVNLIMVYNWWQPDATPSWVGEIVNAFQFDANNFAALLNVGVMVVLLLKYREFISPSGEKC